jgi:hypothetical protein
MGTLFAGSFSGHDIGIVTDRRIGKIQMKKKEQILQ